MSDFIAGFTGFAAYFAAAVAFTAAFAAIYLRFTPHHEYDLLVNQHNASAAVALGGSLIGFSIALGGAVRETHGALEFLAWAVVALAAQLIAYALVRMAHPGLSAAIEQNALASAIWLACASIAAGILCAACMSP